MRVAILGGGGIGLAMAATLCADMHAPVIWSPSGRGLREIAADGLEIVGALTGRQFPEVASDLAEAVGGADIIFVAVPATARRALFDRLAPLLVDGQTVVVSAELSLGAQYLEQHLTNRRIGIGAWSTTVMTGRRIGVAKVEVGRLRNSVAMSVVPEPLRDTVFEQCRMLFRDRFRSVSPIATLLSNLNPQTHMANALCNWTRIEKGESWSNYDGITPSVARLIENLDRERTDLAQACGLSVITVEEHFATSFGLPDDIGLAAMAAELHCQRGGRPAGPTDLSTRFITEDVPYGIVPMLNLASLTGSPMVLHDAGLRLVNSLCGVDHAKLNDLLMDETLTAILK